MSKDSFKSQKLNDLPYITEQLKVSKSSLTARINVLTGKEGDTWICYSSALNVSGYGDTKKEAEESFNLNIHVFCEDLLKLKVPQQQLYLKELGWERKKFAKKQFSKAYVDENGVLQNLTNVKLQSLEAVT
jgi:hypothetical protein